MNTKEYDNVINQLYDSLLPTMTQQFARGAWWPWICAAASPSTPHHQLHLETNRSHNNCDECRADNERSFLRPQWTAYQFVTEYLNWIRPRLAAIRQGEDSVNARIWRRDFRKSLNRRITLKAAAETGRKQNDSYRQRLNQFPRSTADRPLNPSSPYPSASYLRQYAQRGASTLH